MKKLKETIKTILAVPIVRVVYNFIMRGLAVVGSLNRLTSIFYSWIFILPFNREQFAVLRGRKAYYRNIKRDRETHVELRRNIHRLEKGLSMRPRRDIFAKDYINETIEFYDSAVNQYSRDPQSMDHEELRWSHNVLTEYFSAVKPGDATIDAANEKFDLLLSLYSPSETEKKPYLYKDRVKSSVSYEELLKLSQQRRSVRWFLQEAVPRDLIDKALLVGRQSPTACNRLPYEFRIFDEPDLVKKVADLPFGAGGYSNNIPTIIVVVGRLDSYFSPRDRHGIYIDASLAAAPFILALETLGLASCVINWPDFEPLERKMQKTIGLTVDERPIFLIAVGFPDPESLVAYSDKKSLDVLRSYNQIGKS